MSLLTIQKFSVCTSWNIPCVTYISPKILSNHSPHLRPGIESLSSPLYTTIFVPLDQHPHGVSQHHHFFFTEYSKCSLVCIISIPTSSRCLPTPPTSFLEYSNRPSTSTIQPNANLLHQSTSFNPIQQHQTINRYQAILTDRSNRSIAIAGIIAIKLIPFICVIGIDLIIAINLTDRKWSIYFNRVITSSQSVTIDPNHPNQSIDCNRSISTDRLNWSIIISGIIKTDQIEALQS